MLLKIALSLIMFLWLIVPSAKADFWSKLIDVKVVKNTPKDMYEYGKRVGYEDSLNNEKNNHTDNIHYNKGYRDGFLEAILDRDGYVVIEDPRYYNRNHISDRIIIIDKNYDPNRVELFR